MPKSSPSIILDQVILKPLAVVDQQRFSQVLLKHLSILDPWARSLDKSNLLGNNL